MKTFLIIGSGAACYGVALALWQRLGRNCVIRIVDRDDENAGDRGTATGALSRQEISGIYDRLYERFPKIAMPPPKSKFGTVPEKESVSGAPGGLWLSDEYGGLTNHWGGGMLPFTHREMEGWSISAADLEPSYRAVLEKVPVTGGNDPVNDYLDGCFHNRPPAEGILRNDLIRGRTYQGEAYEFHEGVSRLAQETRQASEQGCFSCGECMLGCPVDSVWSAKRGLSALKAEGCRIEHVTARCSHFDADHIHLTAPFEGSDRLARRDYDAVFVAAGCIGTTKLVLRSYPQQKSLSFCDTKILTFPIISLKALRFGGARYMSLSNKLILANTVEGQKDARVISVYPIFDHILRYNTPQWMWSLDRGLSRLLRSRFLIGRIYDNIENDDLYTVRIRDGEAVITQDPSHNDNVSTRDLMRDLTQAFKANRLYVPNALNLKQATSSHYGCSIPYNKNNFGVKVDGQLQQGLYLCDASVFETMPAASPTFTIIANAHRTAMGATF